MISSVYAAYSAIRNRISGRETKALERAKDIVGIERWFHVYHERSLQALLLHEPALLKMMRFTYVALHLPPLLIFAFWAFHTDRHEFTMLRTTFLISAAIGLLIYWLVPTAPPRLLPPEYEIVDRLHRFGPFGEYESNGVGNFVNHYAAMPSLHFAWASLLALGFALIVGWRWYDWVVAIAWPATILMVIEGTGNHFFLDAGVGLIVLILSAMLAYQLWVRVDDHFCRSLMFQHCPHCA